MNATDIISSIDKYINTPISFKQWYNSDNMVVMFDDGGNTITFELEQVYNNGCMYYIKADVLDRETGHYSHSSYEKVQKRVFNKVKEYIVSNHFNLDGE